MMRVLRVLGPIDVGAPPLATKLLALLSLHAGRTVTAGEAGDVLWESRPPPTAGKSLQNLVVSLRRLLGAHAIVTAPSGYCLVVPTDAQRFEELLRGGRLDEALALWRGDPWSELADHPPAVAEAVRLVELRRGAEEDLVEGRLRDGAGDSALVAAAQRLVDEAPLRERRWALLMRALHAAGRSADALRAAQRLRATLAEEMGLSPGDDIRDLEVAIARNDPALRRPAVARGGGAGPAPLEDAARRAGEAAAAAGNASEAVRWLRLAGREPDVLLRLGRAELSVGEPLAAQMTLLTAVEAANAVADSRLVVDALVAAASIPDFGNDVGRHVRDELRRVLRLRLDDRARARLLGGLVLQAAYLADEGELRQWFDEAVVALRRVDEVPLTAEVLSSYSAVGAHPAASVERLQISRDLEELAGALADEATLVRALVLRRWALLELGDGAHRDVASRLGDIAITTRDATSATAAVLWSGGLPLLVGDAAAAEEEVERWGLATTTILPSGELTVAAYVSYLFTVRWMQGRLEELLPLLEQAAASMPAITTWRSARALALAAAGDADAARREAAPFFGRSRLRIPGNGLWSPTVWHLTETTVAVEDRDAARQLIDWITPVADRHALYVSVYLGSFHHHLARLHALLGERRSADAHARAAATAHGSVGASWWVEQG